ARTGRTHQRDEFTGLDGQGDAAQCLDPGRSERIGPGEVMRLEDARHGRECTGRYERPRAWTPVGDSGQAPKKEPVTPVTIMSSRLGDAPLSTTRSATDGRSSVGSGD